MPTEHDLTLFTHEMSQLISLITRGIYFLGDVKLSQKRIDLLNLLWCLETTPPESPLIPDQLTHNSWLEQISRFYFENLHSKSRPNHTVCPNPLEGIYSKCIQALWKYLFTTEDFVRLIGTALESTCPPHVRHFLLNLVETITIEQLELTNEQLEDYRSQLSRHFENELSSEDEDTEACGSFDLQL